MTQRRLGGFVGRRVFEFGASGSGVPKILKPRGLCLGLEDCFGMFSEDRSSKTSGVQGHRKNPASTTGMALEEEDFVVSGL